MKLKLIVDKSKLQQTINEVEFKETFTNRNALYDAIANTKWAAEHRPKSITSSVARDRIKEYGLVCKTPMGKRGRQKGEKVVRTNKPKDTNTTANQALLKYFPTKYHNLAKRVIGGSRQAAVKANCIQCVGFEDVTNQIRQCSVISCPMYNFRPYK